jgi:hypothetical protein
VAKEEEEEEEGGARGPSPFFAGFPRGRRRRQRPAGGSGFNQFGVRINKTHLRPSMTRPLGAVRSTRPPRFAAVGRRPHRRSPPPFFLLHPHQSAAHSPPNPRPPDHRQEHRASLRQRPSAPFATAMVPTDPLLFGATRPQRAQSTSPRGGQHRESDGPFASRGSVKNQRGGKKQETPDNEENRSANIDLAAYSCASDRSTDRPTAEATTRIDIDRSIDRQDRSVKLVVSASRSMDRSTDRSIGEATIPRPRPRYRPARALSLSPSRMPPLGGRAQTPSPAAGFPSVSLSFLPPRPYRPPARLHAP